MFKPAKILSHNLYIPYVATLLLINVSINGHLSATARTNPRNEAPKPVQLQADSPADNPNLRGPRSVSIDELSTESLLEYMDKQFLSKPISQAASKEHQQQQQQQSQLASLAYTSKPDDWWDGDQASLNRKPNRDARMKPKTSNSNMKPIKKVRQMVYIEQPLNQNAILTAKNQLNVIKRQHKLLMSQSVETLVKLDQKLQEGYRICLKRDMPLYAGMLYRTRDYVTKLGRDVKQQRLILESWAKRAQDIITQSVKNNTLIKEFNKLLNKAKSSKIGDKDNKDLKYSDLNGLTTHNEPAYDILPGSNSGLESPGGPELYFNSLPGLKTPKKDKSTTGSGYNKQQAMKTSPKKGNKSPFRRFRSGARSFEPAADIEWVYQKPRVNYVVSLNEINLRKDLQKSQELMDKIERVSRELTDVVDDIIFLSKVEYSIPKSRRQRLVMGQMSLLTEYRRSIELYESLNEIDDSRASDKNGGRSAAYTTILDELLAPSDDITTTKEPKKDEPISLTSLPSAQVD